MPAALLDKPQITKQRGKGHRAGCGCTICRLATTAAAERFAGHFATAAEGCWEWSGKLDPSGYGVFRDDNGREVKAHRFAYEQANGPIPAGLLACHKCDNPKCVRADHLFAGTHADNNWDKSRKGRAVNRFTNVTHCVHGHPFSPENTHYRPGGGRTCKTCNRAKLRAYRQRKGLRHD